MRQLYSNTVSLLKKWQIERDKISSFHIIRCLGNSAEICNNLTNKNTFIQSLSYLDSYVAFKIWKKIFVTKLFWLNWAQFPQNVLFPIFLATKFFHKTLCRIMSPFTVSNSLTADQNIGSTSAYWDVPKIGTFFLYLKINYDYFILWNKMDREERAYSTTYSVSDRSFHFL